MSKPYNKGIKKRRRLSYLRRLKTRHKKAAPAQPASTN